MTAASGVLQPQNAQRLEGTYIFPLPDGATIDKFSMALTAG